MNNIHVLILASTFHVLDSVCYDDDCFHLHYMKTSGLDLLEACSFGSKNLRLIVSEI
jgi:hypothetical protein